MAYKLFPLIISNRHNLEVTQFTASEHHELKEPIILAPLNDSKENLQTLFNYKKFKDIYGFEPSNNLVQNTLNHCFAYYYALKRPLDLTDWFLVGDDTLEYNQELFTKIFAVLDNLPHQKIDFIKLASWDKKDNKDDSKTTETSIFYPQLTTIRDSFNLLNNNLGCYLIRARRAHKILEQCNFLASFSRTYHFVDIYPHFPINDLKKFLPLNRLLEVRVPFMVNKETDLSEETKKEREQFKTSSSVTKLDKYRLSSIEKYSSLLTPNKTKGKIINLLALLKY